MKKILTFAKRLTTKLENTTIYNKNKRVVIAVCTDNYLLGSLKGLCHSHHYRLIQLSSANGEELIKYIESNEPLIIFINLIHAETIFNSPNWLKAQALLKKKNITLCGIGKVQTTRDIALKSYFTPFFKEPIEIDEILEFVRNKIYAANERRTRERRAGIDRRKQHFVNQENDTVTANIPDDIGRNVCVGSLLIDYDAMSVEVNNRKIEVSPREFQLIDLFVRNKGRVVTPESIIQVIWPENNRATKADVHQYIYMLRHKLEKNPKKPQLLLTVKGFGYKLSA